MAGIKILTLMLLVAAALANYAPMDQASLSDTLLLRELVTKMGNDLAAPVGQYLSRSSMEGPKESELYDENLPGEPLDLEEALQMDPREGLELTVPRDIREDLLSLGREEEPVAFGGEMPMHQALRDREYMSHGHMLSNMLAQFPPGSSYGVMRIKPSVGSSPSAKSERKTEGVLPAYCNPPNPCPMGYTAADNCEEKFENTAAFSRSYQSQQDCICDKEHMFDCPDTTREAEIGVLARSIQNEGVLDSTLDKIMQQMRNNPYLQGEKLPIAAKKGSMVQ